MSNESASRLTMPGRMKDDTQPITSVSRDSAAPQPAETPAAADAATETPARTREPIAPASSSVAAQPTPASPPTTPGVPVAVPPGLLRAQKGLERSVRALWAVVILVALLAIASLAVNAVLITRLLAIRSEASAVLDSAKKSLDNLAWQGVSFEFPISQTVNFEGDVPFKQDMAFPFKGNIPINTVISMPVDLGLLGTQTVRVPVNTTVPVDIIIPVKVDQTVHIKTQVPVQMNVPVRIGPNDPLLKDTITQIRQWLERIRKYF
jgi:hypothetical protein